MELMLPSIIGDFINEELTYEDFRYNSLTHLYQSNKDLLGFPETPDILRQIAFDNGKFVYMNFVRATRSTYFDEEDNTQDCVSYWQDESFITYGEEAIELPQELQDIVDAI